MESKAEYALVAEGLGKRYPAVVALDDVSLRLRAGSVHALCGENGAGKSTLVKIVTGAIRPDAGSLRVGDQDVQSLTPRRAAALGIAAIHQERQIAFDLTVGENVLLGRVPRTRGIVDWGALWRDAGRRLEQVGLDLDPRRPVRGLGVAHLQSIEIARALSRDARVLVMDEPTTALSYADVAKLMSAIGQLKAERVAVLYISHHLGDVLAVSDEITVLRDGRTVACEMAANVTEQQLVALMLGRDPRVLERRPTHVAPDDAAAAVVARDLHVGDRLNGVTLSLRRGEVLCVAGAVGSGRRELARCLAGVDRPDRGVVTIDGVVPRGPRDAIQHGVVFIPEDRKREGLLLGLSVRDNIAVGSLAMSKAPLWSPRSWTRKAQELVSLIGIKTPTVFTPVRLLSGGNQQKTVLARCLAVGARAFVFDEPTAGIDVGAKVEIYALLRNLADQGAAVALFTSDTEEMRIMADRLIVLRRGTNAGELPRGGISEESVLALQMGAL